MTPKTFVHQHKVRFGEVDFAGIVYYPNFFNYYQHTEEEFLNHLGFWYHKMLRDYRQGFPIVHVEADFKHPVRLGDTLKIGLQVAKLGRTSAAFGFEVRRAGDPVLCATARITHALLDLDAFAAIPLPEEMRLALARYLAEPV